MHASELASFNALANNGSVLSQNSNHKGGNSLLKYIRTQYQTPAGEPTIPAAGLPATPVTSRFFAPTGPYGRAGQFAGEYQFDWRIYVAKLPQWMQAFLFPNANSSVFR